ncbi:MAG: hypothetical protein LBR52_00805 [Prevotellaceae bacterium]|jgi:chromosome segregation ATPase|nr:hypothetical protein [Prevotellaceae bacterium]
MKKVILGMLVALAAISCNQKKIEALENRVASDSIKIAGIEKERDAFIEIISEVQSNFRTIKEVELGILSDAQGTEAVNSGSKARIQEDFQTITSRLQANKAKIDELEQSLSTAQGEASRYRGLVAGLRKDLETRTKEVAELRTELEAKNIQIQQLDSAVLNLNQMRDSLSSLSQKQIAALQAQDEELNTGWYIVGKKSDLKAKGLKEGALKTAKINKNNFKKIDIREFTELKIDSKSPELYSSHPASSYTLEKQANKTTILKIKDYKSFWSNTNTLIIEL